MLADTGGRCGRKMRDRQNGRMDGGLDGRMDGGLERNGRTIEVEQVNDWSGLERDGRNKRNGTGWDETVSDGDQTRTKRELNESQTEIRQEADGNQTGTGTIGAIKRNGRRKRVKQVKRIKQIKQIKPLEQIRTDTGDTGNRGHWTEPVRS